MADNIEIEILPGGKIKVSADKISGPNHANAEGLFKAVATLGESHRERKQGHAHHHTHEKEEQKHGH
mgnify:CR=1 FL=1